MCIMGESVAVGYGIIKLKETYSVIKINLLKNLYYY
jgi:hypothetical protein